MTDERSEQERYLNPRNTSEIIREMKDRGFTFLGLESLTKFAFTKEAKFETVEYRTADDVRKEYNDFYQGQVELELVAEEGLSQKQKAVLVFGKPSNAV